MLMLSPFSYCFTLQVIDLHIPDPKITEGALKIAFGSLYSHDVVILPSQVISVLAAASLIQLEGLMEQCSEVSLKSEFKQIALLAIF